MFDLNNKFGGQQYSAVAPQTPWLALQRGAGKAMDSFSGWAGENLNRGALFGGTDPTTGMQSSGSFLPLMQGLGSLAQGYLGFQQLGLAQDQFDFQKDAYRTNLANQAQLTNNALYDREKSRAAWESREPTSKEEFLKLNGVQGA